jgi:hypothetical protein
MAAVTGKTANGCTPAQGRRARIYAAPEASSQGAAYTVTPAAGIKGGAALVSAGYISAMTGNIVSITGFYRNAPQNGASDGAKTASLYKCEEGVPFKATYLGTLSQSVRGLRANISVNSNGAIWLVYNSGSSSAGAAVIEGWTSDWAIADVNPEVIFTVRAGNIFQNV